MNWVITTSLRRLCQFHLHRLVLQDGLFMQLANRIPENMKQKMNENSRTTGGHTKYKSSYFRSQIPILQFANQESHNTLDLEAYKPRIPRYFTTTSIEINMFNPNQCDTSIAAEWESNAMLGHRFENPKDKTKLKSALTTISQKLEYLEDNIDYLERNPGTDASRGVEKQLYILAKYVRAHEFFKDIKTFKDKKSIGTKNESWYDFAVFDEALGKLERWSEQWRDQKKPTASLEDLKELQPYLTGNSRVQETPMDCGK